MTEKILLVDDDPNILSALKRQLRRQFQLETALGGGTGLEVMENRGPFAVIVSDMRMPDMDGVQLLSRVKERAPETVRMMLTGNRDLETAMEAVNEGSIFRFLTKPCPPETFTRALQAGLEQYRLIVAERELLEQTLSGSVKLLTEVMSLFNPGAFSQGARVRRYVGHITTQLGLADVWQFEIAAMLSQIGCISVPPRILEKVQSGMILSPGEQRIFSEHPSVGGRLLEHIPRLETISRMIEEQGRSYVDYVPLENPTPEDTTAVLGAQILSAALAFDRMTVRDVPCKEAVSRLREQQGRYNPYVVDALETFGTEDAREEVREVGLRDFGQDGAVAEVEDLVEAEEEEFSFTLTETEPVNAPKEDTLAVGVKDLALNSIAIADEDIRADSGIILVSKGQELTYPVIVRLRSFYEEIGVREPFRVRMMRVEARADRLETRESATQIQRST